MPKRRSRVERYLEPLAAPALALFFLALWQLAVPFFGLSEFVLPTPWQIAGRMVSDFPLLMANGYVTLFEVLAGFACAILGGVPTALAIFYSRAFERAVYPLLIALQTVPKIVLAPLLVLYMGYGWAPKIFLAFLIAYFPIVISTVVGLQSLEPGMVNLVRSMGASEAQTFWKIRLPAALPSIFGGLKVAIALAVIGAVIGEYVAAERGLGYLQLQANAKFDTALNFASVVVVSLIGVLLYSGVMFFERRLVYRRDTAK
jgi:NitT/TauT family transport system permease protein